MREMGLRMGRVEKLWDGDWRMGMGGVGEGMGYINLPASLMDRMEEQYSNERRGIITEPQDYHP